MNNGVAYVLARPFTVLGPGIVIGCLSASGEPRPDLMLQGMILTGILATTLILTLVRAPPASRLVALLACSIQLGRVVTEAVGDYHIRRHAKLQSVEGRAVLEGIVISAPQQMKRPRPPPWSRAEPAPDGDQRIGTHTFELAVERVDGRPISFRARALVGGRRLTVPEGWRIRLRGRVRLPETPGNPGEADPREIAWAYGYAARVSAPDGESITLVERVPFPLPAVWTNRIRRALQGRFRAACRPDTAGFLSAILLGTRYEVSPDVRDRLRKAGSAHVLAISGLHVSLLLPVVWGILQLSGLRYRQRTMWVILLAGSFAVLTGLQPPVLRCLVMATALYLAPTLGRSSDSFNSLGLAAAVIAVCDPLGVRRPAFQLTFAAVVGIMVLAPMFAARLKPEIPPAPPGGRVIAALRTVGRWARAALAVSLSAWLATLPLAMFHFNLVSAVGVAAGLLIIPLIFVELILGILILATASPWVGAAATVCYEGIDAVATAFASFPAAYDFMPAPGWGGWAIYLIGLIGVRWSGRLWILPGVLCLLVVLTGRDRAPPGSVRLQLIDVRRGACAVLEFPDGSVVVCDAGSLNSSVPDRRWIAPALWARGVRRVDALVLSHPDRDHVNGAVGLIERFDIPVVWVGEPFERNPEGGRIVAYLRGRGIDVRVVRSEPAEPVALNRWMTLYPPPPWSAMRGSALPTNETSLVAEVSIGGKRILMMGDAGEQLYGYLFCGRLPPSTEVWIVPHHGKRNRLHATMAAALRPRVALVPAPVGYSAPEVIEGLRKVGAEVYATGDYGAVEVTVGAAGTTVRPFRPKKQNSRNAERK